MTDEPRDDGATTRREATRTGATWATAGAVDRRAFLGLLATAGVAAGCGRVPEAEKLLPYLVPPEHIVPGEPLFYRSVCRECGASCGVTARTREGRVVKLEGNPDDPIGRGALCARGQAALQRLYAPDRLRGPQRRTAGAGFEATTWDAALEALVPALVAARPGGVRMLTRPEPGSAGALQRAFMAALGAAPEDRLVLDPHDPASLRAAGDLLFGRAEIPAFDLAAASSVVSFGADFLATWLSPVELARGFTAGRGLVGPRRTRLTWIGPRFCLTGASADLWLQARAGSEALVAVALLQWLCDPAHAVPDLAPEARELHARLPAPDPVALERRTGIAPAALAQLGAELARRRPSAVLGPGIVGSGPDAAQLGVAVQLLNYALGNIGRTVLYGLDPRLDTPSRLAGLETLVTDMEAGRVQVLLVHHVDPLGALPAAFGVGAALGRVPLVVSFADRLDATTQHAHLVLPDDHPLETFGDVSPRRGVLQLAQPVMTRLGETRAASQVFLDLIAKLPPPAVPLAVEDFHAYVESRLEPLLPGLEGEALAAAKRAAEERGGIYTPAAPEPVRLRLPEPAVLASAPERATRGGELALVVFPTALLSGEQQGNWSWLEEMPDPLTTISWTRWAEFAPATAGRLGVATGDVVALSTAAGRVELPVYVYPGLREDVVAVPLGGPEALALLPAAVEAGSGGLVWQGGTATVHPTGRRTLLPRLEGSPEQGGREIVRTVSAAAPALARPARPRRMYGEPAHPRHRWAMAIDLDRCTGCQACIVACYAENNVPVNGPVLAAQGRNMEWLRLERYYGERAGELCVDFILMLCQHCTSAPCEPVCPVYATYHTSEGLNAQVYNRCVGTRYCSNNCPYKVRTFNWRDPIFPPPLDLQLNPDVTVRSKGVMEKCTFCVQRIRAAEIAAERAGRPLADGEVVPACAQTCPTGAIVFGDANDPRARVAMLERDGRAYHALDELATGTAVTYLARVREESR